MRNTQDPNVKKDVIQAFLFQFGLHIIVLLRPQVWGFLTPFNKVNLLCSFGLAAAYGYLLMGDKRKISTGFASADKLRRYTDVNKKLETEAKALQTNCAEQEARIKDLVAQVADAKRKH